MLPEACARFILKAATKRRREAMSPRRKLGLFFAPIFPGFVDKIAVRVFAEAD
jgi:hypothetical protein